MLLKLFKISLFLWISSSLNPVISATFANDSPHIRDLGQFLPQTYSQAIETILIEHQSLTGEWITLRLQTEPFETPTIKDTDSEAKLWILINPNQERVFLAYSVKMEHHFSTLDQKEDLEKKLRSLIFKNNQTLAPGSLLAVQEILTTLESPLVQNQKLEKILQSWNMQNSLPHSTPLFGWIFLSLSLSGIFLGSIYLITTLDTHYSAEGVWRLSPWEQFKLNLKFFWSQNKTIFARELHDQW